MKILITGAGGFVGQLLAEHLLLSSHTVTLIDIFKPPIPSSAASRAQNATCLSTDLSSSPSSEEEEPPYLSPSLDAIYIFHGIMSAGSESDFSAGYRVNLSSVLHLLDSITRICRPETRVIYASSTAIYGQPLPALGVSETTVPTPSSSYGAQKAMVEYALNDHSRRGHFNAFTLRFPTVSVRPGRPTQAASSWMSGIVREPLQGRESVLPCDDGFEAWLCSPRTLVLNLIHVLTLERESLPLHIRQVNLPGTTVSVRDMLSALEEVGGKEAVALVRREKATKEIEDMLESWPTRFDVSKALRLGFKKDDGFKQAVEDFAASLKGISG